MCRRLSQLTSILLLVCLSGCVSMWPDWRHPGTLDQQRSAASRNYPYPDSQAGPEMVGVTPREYEKPRSELEYARWYKDSWLFK